MAVLTWAPSWEQATEMFKTIGAVVAFLGLFRKLKDIHLTLNSRLDQLVNASKAQGAQEERDSHTIKVEGVPKQPDVL